MKTGSFIRTLTLVLLLAAGCAGNPEGIPIPKEAASLAVDFTWEGIAACTHRSPEIRLGQIPAGTAYFEVRLRNVSEPAWNHGGGKVRYEGLRVIPAGALGPGYNGPCPPTGQRQRFEFSVMAMDAQGVVLGFGQARQVFPYKP